MNDKHTFTHSAVVWICIAMSGWLTSVSAADTPAGHRNVKPEIKYNERGVAIPAPKSMKPKRAPITETRTRTLFAADVIASTTWQQKFNAYIKAKACEQSRFFGKTFHNEVREHSFDRLPSVGTPLGRRSDRH